MIKPTAQIYCTKNERSSARRGLRLLLTFKPYLYLIMSLCLAPAFADNSISVSVSSKDPSAAAIGYTVLGKKSGNIGKSYHGKGPANQTYHFGYRKSVFGANISCGALKLTKNSNVHLITTGNQCRSVLE